MVDARAYFIHACLHDWDDIDCRRSKHTHSHLPQASMLHGEFPEDVPRELIITVLSPEASRCRNEARILQIIAI